MRSPSARKSSIASVPPGIQRFPPSRRLRKRTEFQKVYEQGRRLSSALFTAFCRRSESKEPGRTGLTVPRALGGAVVRNRIKRRLREAIRRHWTDLPAGCEIVIHARRPVVEADWPTLESEVERVFREAGKTRDGGRSQRRSAPRP